MVHWPSGWVILVVLGGLVPPLAAQPIHAAIDPDFEFRRLTAGLLDRHPDWEGPIVAGTVRDLRTGHPIPGARVRFDRGGFRRRSGRVAPDIGVPAGVSDGRGRYVAGALPVFTSGSHGHGWPLEVHAPGYVTTRRLVVPVGEPPARVMAVDFALEPSLQVELRVLDPKGQPLPGARCRLLRDGLACHVAAPRSGDDGRVLWDLGVPRRTPGLAILVEGRLGIRPVEGLVLLDDLRSRRGGRRLGTVRCRHGAPESVVWVRAPEEGFRAASFFLPHEATGVSYAVRPERCRLYLGPEPGEPGRWVDLGPARGDTVVAQAPAGPVRLWVVVSPGDPVRQRLMGDCLLLDPELVVWTGRAVVPPGGGPVAVEWRRPPAQRDSDWTWSGLLKSNLRIDVPGVDPFFTGAHLVPLDPPGPRRWIQQRRPLQAPLAPGSYALQVVGPEGVSARRCVEVPGERQVAMPLVRGERIELSVPIAREDLDPRAVRRLQLHAFGVPIDLAREVGSDGCVEVPGEVLYQATRAVLEIEPEGQPPYRRFFSFRRGSQTHRIRLEPIGAGQLRITVVDRTGRPRPGLLIRLGGDALDAWGAPAPLGFLRDPHTGLQWASIVSGARGRVLVSGVPDGTWELAALTAEGERTLGSTEVRVVAGGLRDVLLVIDGE